MTKFNFSGSLIRAGNNAKTIKGDAVSQYVTAIMYLAPADLSGAGNVCPMALLAGCKEGCLNLSGMGFYSNVQKARIEKTKRFFNNRTKFMHDLWSDIFRFQNKCIKHGRLPAIRLNGTSDIQFERIPVHSYRNIFEAFPAVQFYDYTKIVKRAYAILPRNYNLTLSYSEANQAYADSVVRAYDDTGISVAVVVPTKQESELLTNLKWLNADSVFSGAQAISGDETDLRFLDGPATICILYAKGKARKDESGFVVSASQILNPAKKDIAA